MALELVAGPFTLQDLDGTPVTDLSFILHRACYDDAVGLIAYSLAMGGMCVIQLDGTVCLRGKQARANVIALDLQTPNGFLIHDTLFERAIRKFNKFSMTGANEALLESETNNYVAGINVRTADRFLKILSSGVYWRPLDLSLEWAKECDLEFDGSSPFQTVFRTKKASVIGIGYDTGEIVFYDHVEKRQLELHSFVAENVGIWYSPKFDIYLCLASDDTLSIYANEVRPNSLSSVTAETPLTVGHSSRVKTRMLGDMDEPCVGEIVVWGVTGPAALRTTQSVTDADGYAWNNCTVNVSAEAGDSVVVSAEVNF